MNMNALDLRPLYRSSVGFDQFAEMLLSRMGSTQKETNYPPYNILKTGDDRWRISLAVAGFAPADLEIEQRERKLVITGTHAKQADSEEYIYQGIATRDFQQRFDLAEHIEVTAATHEEGMLHIDLLRKLPEALKPKQINIKSLAKS